MKNELKKSLEQLAYKRSTPFCYNCYKKCPEGRCPICGSDDLMNITKDNGPEYGIDWIIKDILASELTPVDIEEAFEQYVEDCYPDTIQVGWLNVSTASVLKEYDPISWNLVKSEFLDNQVQDEVFFTLDESTYYYTSDVEALAPEED